VLAGVLGDLWNWVAGVFERIGDVSPYWLVVALRDLCGTVAQATLVAGYCS